MCLWGYEVRWEPGQKYITYTTPEKIKCRDNKLFDETLLRENMENYFAMGGCDYLDNRRFDEPQTTVDDAVCGIASIMEHSRLAIMTGSTWKRYITAKKKSKCCCGEERKSRLASRSWWMMRKRKNRSIRATMASAWVV